MENRRNFRLRPVNNTGKIAKKYKYLRSPYMKGTCWAQIVLGTVGILAQIVILCLARRGYADDLAGCGIWISMIQMLGAAFTLMAAEEPLYYWLHTAMAFHIVSVLSFYALGSYIMCFTLPNLRNLYDPTAYWNPYTQAELDIMISCSVLLACCSLFALPTSSVLAFATGRPVCYGHRLAKSISRKSSAERLEALSKNSAQHPLSLSNIYSDLPTYTHINHDSITPHKNPLKEEC